MNNNNFSLLLNRISLAITMLYIGFLFIIVSPSDPIARDGAGMLLAFLFPHLIALALATILNIIISLERSINKMLIGITLILYIIAGLIEATFIPFLVSLSISAVSIQVILLSISVYKFK
ncbi:hypothetical protein O3800_00665 [Gemella sanguinis]|uniref:hypothetical protein n=1 Tax=Gemella sanguinis TaxID=84135 RepID=UPI00352E3009